MDIELGKDGYPIFTPEMKKTHTILIPMMLPIHFEILISVFGQYGYKCEVMKNESRAVVDEGLKNVHNDKKDNKKKVMISIEKYNKPCRRNNSESTKNNGIRGIIKLVDKKGK